MNRNKINQEYVIYSRVDVLKLTRENKWIGNGTADNPFTCDSLNGFSNKFRLRGLNMYITFTNCEFEGIGVIESKNMVFKNCRFKELGLQRSESLSFISCSVEDLVLAGVSNSSFERCEFNLINNFFSYGNTFLNCNIDSTKRAKLAREIFDIGPISIIFALLACFIGFSLITSFFSWLISGIINFYAFIGQLIGTMLLTVFALYFNYASKKRKKRPQNLVINK